MPDGHKDNVISRLQLDMLKPKKKKKFPKDKPKPKGGVMV